MTAVEKADKLREGIRAYRARKPRSANPYDRSKQYGEYMTWDEGWKEEEMNTDVDNRQPNGGRKPGKSVQKRFGDTMRDLVHRKTALAESSGGTGGYTVPPELLVGVDALLAETELFHQYAYQQPMVTATCDIGGFDLTAAHATGDSPLYGGLGLTWTVPGATLTESEPSFAGGRLVARDLLATVYCSNQLIKDGGEVLGAYLEYKFTGALAHAVERQCFVGKGVATPLGLLYAPGTASVTRSQAGHIGQQDIANMVGSLVPASFRHAMFACSVTALQDVAALSSYMVNRNSDSVLGNGLCGTVYGRPLWVTEHLPAKGTLGDLVLFDPRMYVLGRRHVAVDVSTEGPGFLQNQTIFRLWWRGDGQPLVKNTLLLEDNATTVGCYAALL